MKKYKYSRKEIAKCLHSILKFGEESDFPTLWSEINQIKLNLLTITFPPKEKKECGYNCEPCKSPETCEHNRNYKKLSKALKELSTPSPLDETEDIEEINMATYQGKRDTAIEIMVENKLNELIRNQTKIINYLKSKK